MIGDSIASWVAEKLATEPEMHCTAAETEMQTLACYCADCINGDALFVP